MVTLKILNSVGKGGQNKSKDVKLVQALLNVYARTVSTAVFDISGKSGSKLELAIAEFQKNYMESVSPDSRVDANGGTFKNLIAVLDGIFKPVAITDPTYGVVTWDAEGAEGGRFHSRKLHVPSSASGLTIGRGYDMKTKSVSVISKDLTAAGVDVKSVEIIKSAAGIFGEAASQFIIDKDLLDFQVTADAQKKLFTISYDLESNEVKRISGKSDVVLAYGQTDWNKLNANIKDIVIDLKFRGDYTGSTRKLIQKSIADNDLSTFKKALKERTNWSNVPQDRFDRRVAFLDKAK